MREAFIELPLKKLKTLTIAGPREIDRCDVVAAWLVSAKLELSDAQTTTTLESIGLTNLPECVIIHLAE
jgi:hypothetical protein